MKNIKKLFFFPEKYAFPVPSRERQKFSACFLLFPVTREKAAPIDPSLYVLPHFILYAVNLKHFWRCVWNRKDG